MEQWYREDPLLLSYEMKEIRRRHPATTSGFLDDGRIYWAETLSGVPAPATEEGERSWGVLVLCDPDYRSPRNGSVRSYLTSPTVDEAAEIFKSHRGRYPPHILTDEYGNRHLCTCCGNTERCVADTLDDTVRWLVSFEKALVDDEEYRTFTGYAGR